MAHKMAESCRTDTSFDFRASNIRDLQPVARKKTSPKGLPPRSIWRWPELVSSIIGGHFFALSSESRQKNEPQIVVTLAVNFEKSIKAAQRSFERFVTANNGFCNCRATKMLPAILWPIKD